MRSSINRYILVVSLITFFTFSAKGVEIDSLWNRGVDCYAEGDFAGAIESFKEIESHGYSSADLYYNMGSAYYKMSGYIAYSILYYEKALKLDPTHEDAKANLEFVHQFTLDKIDTLPEFVLITWMRTLRNSLTSDEWGYVTLVLVALIAILILFFRFGRNLTIRKVSFVLAVLLLIFIPFSVAFSVGLKRDIHSVDSGIVITPVSPMKSSPSSSGKSLLILHEGSKVKILDELGEWRKVEISDGRQGWIIDREIEII